MCTRHVRVVRVYEFVKKKEVPVKIANRPVNQSITLHFFFYQYIKHAVVIYIYCVSIYYIHILLGIPTMGTKTTGILHENN